VEQSRGGEAGSIRHCQHVVDGGRLRRLSSFLAANQQRSSGTQERKSVYDTLSWLPRQSEGSRSHAVVVVKASKHWYADYDCRIGRHGERWLGGQALSDPLVRPRDIEVTEAVLLQHVLDVPHAEDDDVIETVAPDAAEKSLANRIHERSSECGPKNAHAGALCGTVEVGAELAVVVADDELGPGAEGRSLPELLRRPLRRWVPSYPDMRDLFGVDVYPSGEGRT